MGRYDDPDLRVAALAGERFGVLDHHELLACGLSAKAIRVRRRRGGLLRLHPGVYAVGHAPLRREGRWRAAVLAAGPGAALSDVTALAAWGLPGGQDRPAHVSVAGRAGRASPAGCVLHRRATLRADDVVAIGPLPVTTVTRTVFDVAGVLPRPRLEALVAAAEQRRMLDGRVLAELVAAHPARAGTRALRAVLAAPPELAASELERRFLALVRRAGLPRPRQQVVIGAYTVDFLWEAERVVVENDGFAAHGTRSAFFGDRERDVDLAAAGLLVVRLTYRDVTARPDWVVARLRAVLHRAGRVA